MKNVNAGTESITPQQDTSPQSDSINSNPPPAPATVGEQPLVQPIAPLVSPQIQPQVDPSASVGGDEESMSGVEEQQEQMDVELSPSKVRLWWIFCCMRIIV